MTDYIRVTVADSCHHHSDIQYSTIYNTHPDRIGLGIGSLLRISSNSSLSMEMSLFQYCNFVLSQTILPRAEQAERIWLGSNSSVRRLST